MVVLAIFGKHVHAQLQASQWYFGEHAGLDFTCDPPVAMKGETSVVEGTASIADRNGKLLFYSDGSQIWNKKHAVMQNGDHIATSCRAFPGSGTQSCIIVPQPGSSSIYYVFTTNCIEDSGTFGFRYSVVDMARDGGNGAVTVKNILLFAPATEKVAAVLHTNGTDVWILTHEYKGNRFRAYLLTAAGLKEPVISATGQVYEFGATRCYLKFSPAGDKAVVLGAGLYPEVFDFNDSTGSIASNMVISSPGQLSYYGGSFSPSGKYLYLGCVGWLCGAMMHRYDLDAGSARKVSSSMRVIDEPKTCDNTNSCQQGGMQLGIDGKIYISSTGVANAGKYTSYMGVIHFPDEADDIGYQNRYIQLRCSTAVGFGMPNFIESYFKDPVLLRLCLPLLKAGFSSLKSCQRTVYFTDETVYKDDPITRFEWNFGDPASGSNNSSSYPNPVHIFSAPGSYVVTQIVTTCGRTDTARKVIFIPKNIMLSPDTALCAGDTLVLTGTLTGAQYLWPDGSAGTVFVTARPGMYAVKITIDTCTYTDTINVRFDSLTVSLGNDTTVCEGTPFMLDPGIAGASVRWQDHSLMPRFDVRSTGRYEATITKGACIKTASVYIRVLPKPKTGIRSPVKVCDSGAMLIPAAHYVSYLWQDGSTSPSYYATGYGTYSLTMTDSNDCSATEVIEVKDNCPGAIYVPDAFTPNTDSVNDLFYPITRKVRTISWQLYNQWGQLVFETNELNKGWNGMYKGYEAPPGVYVYTITYTGNDNRTAQLNGNVTLLR